MGNPSTITSYTNDAGGAVSADRLHAIAALLTLHGGTSNNRNAAAVEAALYDLLYGNRHAALWPGGSALFSWSLDDTGSAGSLIANQMGIRTLALQYRNEAVANANNWDGTGVFAIDHTQATAPGDSFTATVTLPGIDDSTGHGWHVDFYVTKPDGTTETIHTTTVNSVATLVYTTEVGVFGTYTVHAQLMDDVPPAWPRLIPSSGNYQALMLSGGATRDWRDPEQITFLENRIAPTISTQISDQVVLPGQTITDTALLGQLIGDDPDVSYAVSEQLVTVPARADGTCPPSNDPAWNTAAVVMSVPETPLARSDIKPDGTATITLGTWTAPENTDPVCASYGETVIMRATGEDDVVITHPVGTTPQTGLVVPVPTLTSQASMAMATPGDVIHDTLYLGNLLAYDDITYTMTGGIYSVPPLGQADCPDPTDPVWQSATLDTDIDPITVTANMIYADGTYTIQTSGWTVPLLLPALCYSYGGKLTVSVGNTAYTYDVNHQAGDPPETIYVISGIIMVVDTGGTTSTPAIAGWLVFSMMALGGGAALVARRRI